MKAIKFEKNKSELWDQFIAKSKNGLFLFNRQYIDYHQDRFKDHSLMIYKNEKLIALFPANEKDEVIHSHEGLTFGGLIMPFNLSAQHALLIFTAIIDYYKNLGFREIRYKAISFIFHKYPAQEDLYALFRLDAILYRRDISSVISLSDPIHFSESKRQAVRKCAKAGMVVIENNNFEDYWQLLESVLSKFETSPVHSLDEIHSLKQNFPEKIRLFEARQSNVLLAGVVVYDYGNCVHTQYMANSAEGRKTGALDFINAKLISDFSDRKYFSFGISTEQEGRYLNEGLIQQKEMMGGRAVVNDFYKIKIK
ncbi:MAG: hypothetical protein ABI172_06150 [Ginsengibacter sp.]